MQRSPDYEKRQTDPLSTARKKFRNCKFGTFRQHQAPPKKGKQEGAAQGHPDQVSLSSRAR